MTKISKKFSFFVKRRSQLLLIVLGSVFIIMLYLNDDASVSKNMELDRSISEMRLKIKQNKDSAQYYKDRYEAITHKNADLEATAREQFHMQRVTEDVYIIK